MPVGTVRLRSVVSGRDDRTTDGVPMSILQLWIVVGVPIVVAAIVLLVGGSPVRARAALGLLVTYAVVLAVTPGAGGASIALVGLPVVVLVASGRLEGERAPRHHETRRRLTTAGGS